MISISAIKFLCSLTSFYSLVCFAFASPYYIDCGLSHLQFPYYSFNRVEKAVFKNLPNLNRLSFGQHSFDGNWELIHDNFFELHSTFRSFLLSRRYSEARLLYSDGILSSLPVASSTFSFPFFDSFDAQMSEQSLVWSFRSTNIAL